MVLYLLLTVMLFVFNFGEDIYSVFISLSYIRVKLKYFYIYLGLEVIYL